MSNPITLFGTDSDQNRITWGNPQKWCSDSLSFLMGLLGVRAPYATRRKLRYEANQVWMNTTFILQGPQSSGNLAVETWRVKTELIIIIITILHIIIITTSILNLGFKTFAPKILAHTKCMNRYWKHTQIFAAKSRQNLLQKTGKTYCKNKLGRTNCKIIKILAHTSKYLRISKYSLPIKIYAHILKYLRIPKIFAYM
jgi:hypothetical protein